MFRPVQASPGGPRGPAPGRGSRRGPGLEDGPPDGAYFAGSGEISARPPDRSGPVSGRALGQGNGQLGCPDTPPSLNRWRVMAQNFNVQPSHRTEVCVRFAAGIRCIERAANVGRRRRYGPVVVRCPGWSSGPRKVAQLGGFLGRVEKPAGAGSRRVRFGSSLEQQC